MEFSYTWDKIAFQKEAWKSMYRMRHIGEDYLKEFPKLLAAYVDS